MAKITVQDLLQAGVHFGHQTKRWNPKMKPYIYGARHGVTIFDLTLTIRKLAQACEFLRDTVANGGTVLFVGTKRQAQDMIRDAAEQTGMFHMSDRWLGGTLTNNKVIMTRTRRLKELRQMEADGTVDEMPNKEASRARRELSKLERTLAGIADLRGLPDALVAVDIERDDIAVKEAKKLGIPVVAVVDSNCDPDPIDYLIPGNDDAVRSLRILVSALTAAIEEGNNQGERREHMQDQEPPSAAAATTPPETDTETAEDEQPADVGQSTADAEEEPAGATEETDTPPENNETSDAEEETAEEEPQK